MSTIAIWLSKTWLVLVMAAVGMGSLPMAPVNAAGPSEAAPTPTPVQGSHDRLQRAWEREQRIYTRLGRFLDHSNESLARAQGLIDKAKANGKDVAAAARQAQLVYEGGKDIPSAHRGFEASGNVIDTAQAFQTVTDLRGKLLEIRQIAMPPRKALRDAIKAFRDANQPVITPTPTGAEHGLNIFQERRGTPPLRLCFIAVRAPGCVSAPDGADIQRRQTTTIARHPPQLYTDL